MGMPSGFELVIIIAAIVLLFGGKKIPELAKGLGQGIKNFKGAIKEDEPVELASEDKDKEKIDDTKVSEAKKEEEKTTV